MYSIFFPGQGQAPAAAIQARSSPVPPRSVAESKLKRLESSSPWLRSMRSNTQWSSGSSIEAALHQAAQHELRKLGMHRDVPPRLLGRLLHVERRRRAPDLLANEHRDGGIVRHVVHVFLVVADADDRVGLVVLDRAREHAERGVDAPDIRIDDFPGLELGGVRLRLPHVVGDVGVDARPHLLGAEHRRSVGRSDAQANHRVLSLSFKKPRTSRLCSSKFSNCAQWPVAGAEKNLAFGIMRARCCPTAGAMKFFSPQYTSVGAEMRFAIASVTTWRCGSAPPR